ncbi:MAG: hypothetical protein J5644_09165 [Bacteroidales bacterium]|nr:hypothetical protein [Bacteroidales bacterium]
MHRGVFSLPFAGINYNNSIYNDLRDSDKGKTGQIRDKYARTLCCEINRKLYEGWNPFMENDAYFSGTSMQKGIREFLEAKGKKRLVNEQI